MLNQGDPEARRLVPASEEYKAYQVQQGLIQPDALGLYRPVFLHDFQLMVNSEAVRRA
jgi:hypothetical protein